MKNDVCFVAVIMFQCFTVKVLQPKQTRNAIDFKHSEITGLICRFSYISMTCCFHGYKHFTQNKMAWLKLQMKHKFQNKLL